MLPQCRCLLTCSSEHEHPSLLQRHQRPEVGSRLRLVVVPRWCIPGGHEAVRVGPSKGAGNELGAHFQGIVQSTEDGGCIDRAGCAVADLGGEGCLQAGEALISLGTQRHGLAV